MAALEFYNTTLFLDSSLHSYYRFEGNANDSKGSNNGSATAVTYNASYGAFGQGGSFDGSTSIITTPNTLSSITALTILAWIKPQAALTHHTIVSLGTSGTADGELLSVGTDSGVGYSGKIVAAHYNGSAWQVADSTITPSSGTGYFVALTNDGSNIRVYVDGVKKATTAVTGSIANGIIQIGKRYYTTGSSSFNGYQDEVAVFTRTLSDQEIEDYYNGLLARQTARRALLGVGV